MAIEFDLPLLRGPLDIRIDPRIDAAEVLARHWNDRMPAGENLETIAWWLRQCVNGSPPPRADQVPWTEPGPQTL